MCNQIVAQSPSIDPHWELVWFDDFTEDTINLSKWSTSPGWGTCIDYSTQTDTNFSFSNGVITLISRCQPSTCYLWADGISYYSKDYTAGCLYSTKSFKYGYFEIKSKFPYINYRKRPVKNGSGFSPCFWLFPNYHKEDYYDFVTYSEIDIYEIAGKQNRHTCNVHYGDTLHPYNLNNKEGLSWSLRIDSMYLSPNDSTSNKCPYDFIVNDNKFHTFASEWNSKYVRMFYDNIFIRSAQKGDIFDASKLIPMNIFITNGANSWNFFQGKYDSITVNTILPYYYEVDYVKVYHLKCDKTSVVVEIPDFVSYNYAVKKSITMSSSTTIPPNTITCLRATDFIELRDGFQTSTGATLYLTTCPCDTCSVIQY